MNKCFEKNLKLLEESKHIVELVGDYENIRPRSILTIEKDNKLWMLQSNVNMEIATDCWANQFDNLTYEHILFVCGFGHPDYLRKVAKRFPECPIVVYVPNEILLAIIMVNYDIEDLITNDKILIVAGDNLKNNWKSVTKSIITNISRRRLEISVLPNIEKIYPEETKYYMEIIRNGIESSLFSSGTNAIDAISRGKAYLYTVNNIINNCIYTDLCKKFDEINPEGLAIVVGAGPSLNKNFHLLKSVKNKALIICVDSAAKALLSQDIIPDLVCCVDAEKDPTIFKDERLWKVPLIIEAYANYEVAEAHKGKHLYFVNSNSYITRKYLDFDKYVVGIDVGGTVTHAALTIAYNAGFKNIALIGQDLGYPNNQTHADGKSGETKYDVSEENETYFYVEDVFGGKVLTEGNMNYYRKWFEEWIEVHPEINLIDATEGGAKIHGTKIMPLQECIDEYLGDKVVDYQGLANSVEVTLNESEKEKYLQDIKSDYDRIDKCIAKLRRGKKLYDELLTLYDKGLNGTKEYKKLIKRISKLNSWIESEAVFKLFGLYNNFVEIQTAELLAQRAKDEKEEVEISVKTGKLSLDGYIEAAKYLKKEWKVDEAN